MPAVRLLAILAALAISAFVALTTAHADRPTAARNFDSATPSR